VQALSRRRTPEDEDVCRRLERRRQSIRASSDRHPYPGLHGRTSGPYLLVDLRVTRSTLAVARIANASMVMTYDRDRVVSRAGRISAETQLAVDRALGIHLGLAPT